MYLENAWRRSSAARSKNLSDGVREPAPCLPVRGSGKAGEKTLPNGLKSCSGPHLMQNVNRENRFRWIQGPCVPWSTAMIAGMIGPLRS